MEGLGGGTLLQWGQELTRVEQQQVGSLGFLFSMSPAMPPRRQLGSVHGVYLKGIIF